MKKAKVTTVSIIIPTFNDKKNIDRAINSVLHQKNILVEIIIIDDASSDGTYEYLREKYNQKNIYVLKHKVNQNLGASRNTGMDQAKGNFLMFLDSDDWLEPDAISKIVKTAVKNKSEITAFGVAKAYSDGSKTPFHAISLNTIGGINAITHYSRHEIGSIVWNKLYLRSFIEKNKLRFTPEYYHEDVLFTAKSLILCKKFISIPDIFYNYYQRNESIINQKPQLLHLRSYIRLFLEMTEFIKKNNDNFKNDVKIPISLITAHCLTEVIPKLIRYRSLHGIEKFKNDLYIACQKEVPNSTIETHAIYNQLAYLGSSKLASDKNSKRANRKLVKFKKENIELKQKIVDLQSQLIKSKSWINELYNTKSWKIITFARTLRTKLIKPIKVLEKK